MRGRIVNLLINFSVLEHLLLPPLFGGRPPPHARRGSECKRQHRWNLLWNERFLALEEYEGKEKRN